MEIAEALRTLDPNLATHWTKEGAPRADVVSGIVGRAVTRADIDAAAPDFNRETALDALKESDAAALEADENCPRTWLYHSNCPEGRVFEGVGVAAAIADGWVDTPTKLVGGPSPPK